MKFFPALPFLQVRPLGLLCLLGPLLIATLPGCGMSTAAVAKSSVTLAEKTRPDGAKAVYKLYPGQGSAPKVHRIVTSQRLRPILNTTVRSVSADQAARLDVKAWNGVLVERVAKDSAATRAGLLEGDVILSLDGTALTSQQQFDELLPSLLEVGRELELAVLRPAARPAGEDGAGAERAAPVTPEALTIRIVPDTKQTEESKTDAIALEWSEGVQSLTGAQIATIPPDLALEIFDREEPVAIVSGVIAGSSAYLAGLRKGDRIVAADGQAVDGMAAVRDLVRSHALGVHLPLDKHDLGTGRPVSAASGGPLTLAVDGPLGPHEAAVNVSNAVEDSTSFYFPILLDYDSDVEETRWSFLDFIFQFGANYSSRYHHSSTRNPAETTTFSMLPLGMFEYESTPTYHEYTFFWLITWKTRG